MKKYNSLTIKVSLCLSALVLFAYWGVWKGFFQQDEWAGLAGFFSTEGLSLNQKIDIVYGSMFRSGLAHFLPLVPLANYLRYILFGFDYFWYAVLSNFLHIIASLLVYLFIKKITQSQISSLIGGVFFSLAATGSQAVTWVGTSMPTQMAVIFSIISAIFFVDWLEKKKTKNIIFAVIFLLTAVFFKETAFSLFVFFPILGILKEPKLKPAIIRISFGLTGVYLIIRILLFLRNSSENAVIQLWELTRSVGINYFPLLLRGMPELLIPQHLLLSFGRKIIEVLSLRQDTGTFEYDFFLENSLLLPMTIIIGILTVGVVLALVVFWKKEEGRLLFYFLLWVLCSFIPLTFIASSEIKGLFIPSRDLYLPLVGMSGMVGVLFDSLLRKKSYLVLLMFLLLFLVHLFYLKFQNKELIEIGQLRYNILDTVKSRYPDLGTRTVFYFESDRPYYGLPNGENVLPFQSGLGQTLLVWYYPTEKFPKDFLKNRFLWELASQGYQEVGERGFGYFRNFDLLRKTIKQNNLSSDSVIAFSWNSTLNTLFDITDKIRGDLEK